MSDQYFINRQDRYMWLKECPELADYFTAIVETICNHSFAVTPEGSTCYPKAVDFDYLNTLNGKQKFISSLRDEMNKVICYQSTNEVTSMYDTIVYPLVQMGQYDIRQEEQVMVKLLEECTCGDHVHLASGYFNLPKIYMNTMLSNLGSFSVLAASPQVYSTVHNPVDSDGVITYRLMGSMVLVEYQAMSPVCTYTLPIGSWKKFSITVNKIWSSI